MATRGYQSYRGRNHGKLALVIVLVLILLAAVGYLVAQEYMVYDDEGHRHLELPFLKKGQTEQPQQPEDTTPDDVNLIIDEPERPLLKELHARQLPDTVLTEDPSAVLAEHPEAVVIPVKLRDGTVTDRKSTRLNSSHLVKSYAVFCLKKKKKEKKRERKKKKNKSKKQKKSNNSK